MENIAFKHPRNIKSKFNGVTVKEGETLSGDGSL